MHVPVCEFSSLRLDFVIFSVINHNVFIDYL
jgi:hypothetical protein